MTKRCQRLFLLISATTLLLTGCEDEPEADESPEPVVEEDPAPELEARVENIILMAEHYMKASEARQALISAEMETAQTAMQWLADNETNQGSLPDEARPHLTAMRERAGAFAEAETLTEAGVAFGRVLTTCGDCHAAVEQGPTFTAPPVPEGEELPARMQRHRWSAERMWDGLVARDEGTYRDGALVLEDVILHPEELPQGVLEPERVQAIADRVHELGDEALEAEDWAKRGEVYGEFLATCATCHRAMGVGAVARSMMEPPDTARIQGEIVEEGDDD